MEKAQSVDLLGVALLESGREREAVDKLEAALLARPGDPELLYYLSLALARLSKQASEILMERSPTSARARQMLGEARAAGGNRGAAAKDFRAALAARDARRDVDGARGER